MLVKNLVIRRKILILLNFGKMRKHNFLYTMNGAHRYEKNAEIRKDFKVTPIKDEIR